jgi:hypothetical protein
MSPRGPSGPSGPAANIIEAPTEIALAAKIAITIPAINLPIVIETAAIFLTQKHNINQIVFNSFHQTETRARCRLNLSRAH